MSESKYRDFLRLTSAITRVVGIIGFVGSAIFWAFTQLLEPVLLGACVTLMGVGQGLDVVKEIADTRAEIRKLDEAPPPAPSVSQTPPTGTSEA